MPASSSWPNPGTTVDSRKTPTKTDTAAHFTSSSCTASPFGTLATQCDGFVLRTRFRSWTRALLFRQTPLAFRPSLHGFESGGADTGALRRMFCLAKIVGPVVAADTLAAMEEIVIEDLLDWIVHSVVAGEV